MGVIGTLLFTTFSADVVGTGIGGPAGEILPQSVSMYHSKLPAFSAIVGILVVICC